MLFNSYQFIFAFLPVTLAVCFLLARFAGAGAAQLWLTAASLFFYASWNLQYLPLLLGSIAFNYAIAVLMTRADRPARRRALLLFAVAVDLALLGYYKYTNFFVDSVNGLTGTRFLVGSILLPLGISFYTFQQITLLVDISSGEIHRFRARDFLLFVIFFPHLIAGPIVHHREMMPQFERAQYRFDWTNMAVGLTLFAAGLFKKAIIADGIASQIVPMFADANAGHPVTFLYAWAAALGFTLQMYFDFSGYSEMALGLGRMVGITLPMNFNSPLKAASIIEYWSRWHMTLTRFLTAYIYNPIVMALTRARVARGKRGMMGTRTPFPVFVTLVAFPTVTTMFLSGLWHGAGYQYLVFGLLHGTYLVINHCWRLYRTKLWKDNVSYQRVMRPVGFVLTFVGAMVALTYFHADSVRAGTNVVSGLIGLNGVALPDVIQSRMAGLAATLGAMGVEFRPLGIVALITVYLWIAVLMPIVMFAPNVLQIMRDYQPAITLPAPYRPGQPVLPTWLYDRLVWRPTTGWAMVTAVLSLGGLLTLNQITEFLYWQF